MYRVFIFSLFIALSGHASEDVIQNKKIKWPFEGIFGKVDKSSAQRGYQVYKEVCAACHSMNRIHFRNLEDIGFSKEEVKSLAAEFDIQDSPDDEGEMFERKGLSSDRFPAPFANEQASRAANNGAHPPDLSLITKAEFDGPNFVYSILTGFEDTPKDFQLPEGKYYNEYFPGGAISMAPPLSEDIVTYQDETPATIDNMAKDVVNFLQWAAEPEMESRKKMGIGVIMFLSIFCYIMYRAKKEIWKDVYK